MKTLRLKTKLALAVSLLFVLVIVFIASVALTYLEQSFRQNIAGQLFALVSAQADHIDDKLRMAHDVLSAEARKVPPAAIGDSEQAQRFLDARAALLTMFDNGLFLISRDGRLIAESPYLPDRRGYDYSAKEFFRESVAAGKPHISRPYISAHAPGHPAVFFSIPLFDSRGTLRAILGGSTDLWGENLLRELSRIRIGETGYFYLTDQERTVIYHPDRRRIMTKAQPGGVNRLYDKALAGFEGSGETRDGRGEQELSSFKRLLTTDWVLAADYPLDEAYAPLATTKRFFLLTTLAFMIAVLAITRLLLNRLTGPLLAVARHVESLPEKIGRERLLEVDSADEVGLLARAFNRMVMNLETQQTALRESEEKFSRAFSATPALLAISTMAEGRYLEVNETFARVFGYGRGEIIGRTSRELDVWTNPHDRERMMGMLEQQGRIRDQEIAFRCKTGKTFIGLLSVEIIEISGKEQLFSLIYDITALRQAEEELRASQEQLALVLEGSEVGFWDWNIVTGEVYFSPRCAEMLGYRPDEIEPNFSACEKFLHPEDLPLFVKRAGELVEGLVLFHQDAYRMRASTGEWRWIKVRGKVVKRAEDGTPLRGAGTHMDITERKRAAEEIEKLNTDLACRAAELEAANRELEAFNYTVSHDLRSPLSGVRGLCQLVINKYGASLDGHCLQILQKVLLGTEQMSQIVTTLLQFSQMKGSDLPRELVDLSEMARVIVSELRAQEPKRLVTFAIRGQLQATGDARLLRQALENLFSNAWKFTRDLHEARIEFDAAGLDGVTTYFVRDNGIGFAQKDADRMFKAFQQLHGDVKFEGHGIGLATAQRIIQRHGGQIWAEGEPGKGATFYFTL
jgi:PAS domain S-box-containing protein